MQLGHNKDAYQAIVLNPDKQRYNVADLKSKIYHSVENIDPHLYSRIEKFELTSSKYIKASLILRERTKAARRHKMSLHSSCGHLYCRQSDLIADSFSATGYSQA